MIRGSLSVQETKIIWATHSHPLESPATRKYTKIIFQPADELLPKEYKCSSCKKKLTEQFNPYWKINLRTRKFQEKANEKFLVFKKERFTENRCPCSHSKTLLKGRERVYWTGSLGRTTSTFRMSWFLYRTTLVPFGANPYLCTSTDIEVTPWTEKSNGGTGYLIVKHTTSSYHIICISVPLEQSFWTDNISVK